MYWSACIFLEIHAKVFETSSLTGHNVCKCNTVFLIYTLCFYKYIFSKLETDFFPNYVNIYSYKVNYSTMLPRLV